MAMSTFFLSFSCTPLGILIMWILVLNNSWMTLWVMMTISTLCLHILSTVTAFLQNICQAPPSTPASTTLLLFSVLEPFTPCNSWTKCYLLLDSCFWTLLLFVLRPNHLFLCYSWLINPFSQCDSSHFWIGVCVKFWFCLEYVYRKKQIHASLLHIAFVLSRNIPGISRPFFVFILYNVPLWKFSSIHCERFMS